ncbi:MAG: YDG domain-containing protein, partial [Actinomycetes bacterium]
GAFTADNKPYDGTTDATVATRSLVGTITGDIVSLMGGTAAFADKDANVGIIVTLTGATLDGADKGNYDLTSVTDARADITAKNLTIIGAVAENKTYDASTDATVTFTDASLEGVESGDGVGIDHSAYSASFDTASWGIGKDVTVLGVKLSGVSKANYTVSQPAGLKANIDKRSITVTAGSDRKDYDGTTSSTVLPTVTDGSLVSGQAGTWVQVFDSPNVGDTRALKPSGTIKGAAEADVTSNYDIAFDDSQGIIDPRPIDVTADDQLKTYGSVDPTLTYTITAGSLVGSDAFSGSPKRVAGETVGDYMIDQGTLSLSDNYGLVFGSGTLTIQQRPITVTAVTDIKAYDGTTSSTVLPERSISTPLATGDTGTWSQVFSQSHVGFDVQLEPSGIIKNLADVDGTNQYDISFDSVYDGEITARPITLTAKTYTRAYDGTTTSSVAPEFTAGSLVAGDVGTWRQEFDSPDVGTGKTLSPHGSIKNAVDVDVTNQYDITAVDDTTGEITALSITVTAGTDTKPYDGTTSSTVLPTLTSGALPTGQTGTWVQTFDSATRGSGKTLTPTGTVKDAGDVDVTANYTITFTPVTDGEITKRAITATAANKSKVVGASDPALTYTVTTGSLVTGDSFSGEITRTAGEGVGTYPITQGTLALTSNYTLSFVDGTFSITTPPAPTSTVTFDSQGGSAVSAVTGVANNTALGGSMPAAPTKAGFTFAGWNTAANGSGSAFTSTTLVTANITVFAQWTAIPPTTSTVTFDSQGGSAVAPVTGVAYNTALGAAMPAAPTKAGFTFTGWNTAANGSGSAFTSTTLVTANITVFAQWTAIPPTTSTVTFDSQGGSAVAPVTGVAYNTALGAAMPAAPTKAGFTFAGWNTAANGSGSVFDSTTLVTADITVFAQWTANRPAPPTGVTYGPSSGGTLIRWIASPGATGYQIWVGGVLRGTTGAGTLSFFVPEVLGPNADVKVDALGASGAASDPAAGTYQAVTSGKIGTVRFSFNSPKLTPATKRALRSYAKTIAAQGFTRLTVNGYTSVDRDGGGTTASR